MTKQTDKTGEQLLAEDTKKSQAIAVVANKMGNEQLEMNQWLGRIQATQAVSNMLEALSLSQLQQIKDNKLYERLKGQEKEINGKVYDLGTWRGFCRAIGSNFTSVDTKLKDLKLLGETALENAQNLGMTTRELAKLRKLDPSDQNVIINELEANIGDKEAIVELIENMSAKHVKDKEELQKKIEEERAERKASDAVAKKHTLKINELEKQLAREEAASPYDRAVKLAQEVSQQEQAMLAVFGNIDKLFAHIQQQDELPDVLRVNMGQLLNALKYQADSLVDKYQLGDISVDDDQLDWVAELQKDKAAGEAPEYATAGVE